MHGLHGYATAFFLCPHTWVRPANRSILYTYNIIYYISVRSVIRSIASVRITVLITVQGAVAISAGSGIWTPLILHPGGHPDPNHIHKHPQAGKMQGVLYLQLNMIWFCAVARTSQSGSSLVEDPAMAISGKDLLHLGWPGWTWCFLGYQSSSGYSRMLYKAVKAT